jgi:hypothetical protein
MMFNKTVILSERAAYRYIRQNKIKFIGGLGVERSLHFVRQLTNSSRDDRIFWSLNYLSYTGVTLKSNFSEAH